MESMIIHIMESCPLQLVLQTPAGHEHVMLAENVQIQRRGILIDPGKLQPGQRVRILIRTDRGEISGLEVID